MTDNEGHELNVTVRLSVDGAVTDAVAEMVIELLAELETLDVGKVSGLIVKDELPDTDPELVGKANANAVDKALKDSDDWDDTVFDTT